MRSAADVVTDYKKHLITLFFFSLFGISCQSLSAATRYYNIFLVYGHVNETRQPQFLFCI